MHIFRLALGFAVVAGQLRGIHTHAIPIEADTAPVHNLPAQKPATGPTIGGAADEPIANGPPGKVTPSTDDVPTGAKVPHEGLAPAQRPAPENANDVEAQSKTQTQGSTCRHAKRHPDDTTFEHIDSLLDRVRELFMEEDIPPFTVEIRGRYAGAKLSLATSDEVGYTYYRFPTNTPDESKDLFERIVGQAMDELNLDHVEFREDAPQHDLITLFLDTHPGDVIVPSHDDKVVIRYSSYLWAISDSMILITPDIYTMAEADGREVTEAGALLYKLTGQQDRPLELDQIEEVLRLRVGDEQLKKITKWAPWAIMGKEKHDEWRNSGKERLTDKRGFGISVLEGAAYIPVTLTGC